MKLDEAKKILKNAGYTCKTKTIKEDAFDNGPNKDENVDFNKYDRMIRQAIDEAIDGVVDTIIDNERYDYTDVNLYAKLYLQIEQWVADNLLKK